MAKRPKLPWWFWAGATVAVVAFVYFVWEPDFLYRWGWKRTYHTEGGEIDLDFVDSLKGSM